MEANPASESEASDPPTQDASSVPKTKRRTRHDQTDRIYKCGCGKTYLSYPALYTHIKQKHDGISPDGTTAPINRNGRTRGRPKQTGPRSGYEKLASEEEAFYQRHEFLGGPSNALEA
jgi:hypothetical protein